MKSYCLFLLSLLVGLSAAPTLTSCSQVRAELPLAASASSNVTRTIDLTDFNKLELATSGDVLFTPTTDGTMSAVLSVPADVADQVEVYVKNNTLVFRNKVSRLVLPRDTKMTLTVRAPMVNRIMLNGSGDVRIQSDFSIDDDLKLMINGSGDVKFPEGVCKELSVLTNGSGDVEGRQLTAKSVSISVNGSGDFELDHVTATKISTAVKGSGDVALKGKCEEASFIVVGSGDVKAENLEATTVSVKIVGSGDVKCNAAESLSVNRIGSGTVKYKGTPTLTGLVVKGVSKL
jgi:hypothetical protein